MKEIYNLTGKTTEEAAKIIDEAIKPFLQKNLKYIRNDQERKQQWQA